MDVTVYYKPDCGTFRKVLGFIREKGFDPHVIEYLKTPPNRTTMESIFASYE